MSTVSVVSGGLMLNVTIEAHRIRFGPRCAISFQRTLRIPDDGKTYPLPPGLGVFPLSKVDDYSDRVPLAWREHSGAFLPMYQREALWLGFDAAPWKPSVVKVSIGGINAISGERDDDELHATPQDYVVCPPQLWLDGINSGEHRIRQFVAVPLGQGYTIEAALTGSEKLGGIQIVVFDPHPGRFPDEPPPPRTATPGRMPPMRMAAAQPMGIGAGGTMRQKIYPDPYGIDTWDLGSARRVMVHLLNSADYHAITGMEPPPTPVDAHTYTQHGFPWFDLYDEHQGDVAAPERLTTVKSIAEHDREQGVTPLDQESLEVPETQIKKIEHEE